MLADTSQARLREIDTLVFDQSQNANLYRRDLLVTVEVAVPSELTDEQRAAVEELARVIDPPSRTSLGV